VLSDCSAVLVLFAFMTVGCTAQPRPSPRPGPPAPPRTAPHECNQYCDFGNNPCDPSSGCTCSEVTSTCEARDDWCFTDQQCQSYLGDPGAQCVQPFFACWGTGVNCQSTPCEEGYGCQSNQDCAGGYTCSTSNGLCLPAGQPVSSCPTGWTWDPNFPQGNGAPNGGCAPPASWPAATDCQAVTFPPTCLSCTQPPWFNQRNCPHYSGGATTYMYGFQGSIYCCIDPPY